MNVCFETFGCRLNKAEALQMEADYLAKGWELTTKHKDANLFVVRGCSVTSTAQRECERLIEHLKRKYPLVPIRICGCLDRKRLHDLGLDMQQQTDTLVRSVRPVNRKASPPADGEALPTRTARAYLKVQDGCAGRCAFCIVPKFRGQSVSIPLEKLTDKAKRFIDAGYHEIVVTGCNLSLYASDGKRLPELLSALAELDAAGCRIRLGSLEPGSVALDTVQAMAAHANICRFLHIPIQSGSSIMLRAMGRPYSPRDVEQLVRTARKLMPTIGIGCDLMTGFPGESHLDHLATLGMANRLQFSNAHVFPYSKRPNTPASLLDNQVPHEVRLARARELIKLTRKARENFAKSFIGKTVEIVVEDAEKSAGWTGEYLRCRPLAETAERKSLARIIVTKTTQDRLYGRLARD